MLSAEENERLTQVGPGTPMGRLLRRYWHPIAAQTQLEKEPVKAVTLLGESLVLYRDLGGQLGLLAEPCMHRRASLAYGIPEARGLRCPYHGWLYAEDGQCLEQPAEPAFRWTDSGGPSSAESAGLEAQARGDSFADRIRTTAYPVEELGGLIFAYLGELPAPALPRYNV
ncbi:MAG TPA: Rieske 2Fe-2S domain-containing protein, partial [Chloroflexota bacterium]